jgi:cystathionine beta-lyase/cystathionine gamma-synthase
MNDIKVSEKLNKLVRFSIGLENPDFLLADIIKSYQTVKGR